MQPKDKERTTMRISERLTRIKPSATMAVSAKANELKAKGREVINLGLGEPDFNTPMHVREAAKKAVDQGYTRYTPAPGLPELRQAIAEHYYGRFYDVMAEKECTIASNGGKQVLYNLLMALVNPGDGVLIPAPYWVSYPAMVKLADGRPQILETSVENDFLATVEELDERCNDRTKVLILNSPSNPTGGCYTQPQLEEIARWARDRGVFVISDEVYDRLVYPPTHPATLSNFWERHPESVAIVGALSKSFCMTGFRLGWALAHKDLVKAMTKLQGQSTSNVNSVAQRAALAALEGPWDRVEEMNTEFQKRRDIAFDIISSWPNVICPKPMGAFYLFPQVVHYYTDDIPDSSTLCTHILEKAGVALVPGVAFGDDRCVRFSYAIDEESLRRAVTLVGEVLLG